MSSVTIDIKGLDKFILSIGKDVIKKVDHALYESAERGRKLLIERTPLGVSSQMRQAWSAPQAFSRISDRRFGYTVENVAPHAAIVEWGSRPHMPPVLPIALWVMRVIGPRLKDEMKTLRRRGIKLTDRKGTYEATGEGEARTMQGALSKEVMRIAYLIAWKIKARGTRAQNIAGGAEPQLRRIVEEELNRAMAEEK